MFPLLKTILVRRPARGALAAATLAAIGSLAGCGQKGPLYLPTGEAAIGRATLPQTIMPGTLPEPAATSASPAASPASAPGLRP